MKSRSNSRFNRVFCFLLLLTAPLLCPADSFKYFDDFLLRYRQAASEDRSELVESFINQQKSREGFPIVGSDGNVLFFYAGSGNEKEVRVIGDFRIRSFYNVYWDVR